MGNSDHGTTYVRVRGDDGELRPWHLMYVYSIESRLIRRETQNAGGAGNLPAPAQGFGFWVLGLGVWGLGFMIWGLGFSVEGLGFRA